MIKWITSNPLIAGGIVVVLIAAIFAFFYFQDKGEQRHEEQLTNRGELIERSKGNEKVLNNVRTANDAADRPSGNQLNVVCSKYDRNCPDGQ